jgi:hypothetical protein
MIQKKTSKKMQPTATGAKKTQKNWQTRTWAQIGKLAAAALETLEAGDTRGARELLKAIRGVALAADQDGL